MAIARACGFNQHDISTINELYKEFWPIYRQKSLSESKRARAIKLLGDISLYMDGQTRTILNMKDAAGYFAFIRSGYVLNSMDDNPADLLRKIRCPVLVVAGGKDVQIPPRAHNPAIEEALKDRNGQVYTMKEFPDLNHLFQRSKSGLPSEYATGNPPMGDEVLKYTAEWILGMVNRDRDLN